MTLHLIDSIIIRYRISIQICRVIIIRRLFVQHRIMRVIRTLQGLTEIAGVDIDGGWKNGDGWTLQEWTMTEDITWGDFAGVDKDGGNRRSGQWRSGLHRVELSRQHRIFTMVALCNRADHYFLPCGYYLSIFFISSPNLSGRRLDVYHTSTHGVALVRI